MNGAGERSAPCGGIEVLAFTSNVAATLNDDLCFTAFQ